MFGDYQIRRESLYVEVISWAEKWGLQTDPFLSISRRVHPGRMQNCQSRGMQEILTEKARWIKSPSHIRQDGEKINLFPKQNPSVSFLNG